VAVLLLRSTTRRRLLLLSRIIIGVGSDGEILIDDVSVEA
jgi:hypothetical protein